jgi:hypothetical protein
MFFTLVNQGSIPTFRSSEVPSTALKHLPPLDMAIRASRHTSDDVQAGYANTKALFLSGLPLPPASPLRVPDVHVINFCQEIWSRQSWEWYMATSEEDFEIGNAERERENRQQIVLL